MIEIKDTKNILKSSNIILICLIVFLCSYLYITDPIITGDGHEYLGMTASFFNHLSPDLQEKDIELRNYVENENGINFTGRSQLAPNMLLNISTSPTGSRNHLASFRFQNTFRLNV